MANPLFPDITGQEYDPLWARQMAEQDIPRVPAQYQQTPNFNLGPLHLNGSGVDAASLAVLRAMQNMPQPKGALGGLASGLVSGYAGARASQAQSRQVANEKEDKRVLGDDIERRKQAAAYGRSLAQHRWQMQRDAAKFKMEQDAKVPKVDNTVEVTPAVREEAAKNGIYLSSALLGKRLSPGELTRTMPEKRDPNAVSPMQMLQRENYLTRQWDSPQNRAKVQLENSQMLYTRGVSEASTKDNMGDVALVRTLAKGIDDRTGVREEENRAYQMAVALRDRLKAEITRLTNGGTLTDTARASIVAQLKILKDDARMRYMPRLKYYRDRAAKQGLDPEIIYDIADQEDGPALLGGNSGGKAFLESGGK